MYILGFNGPPRVGKGTIAKAVADLLEEQYPSLPIITQHLSLPMRKVAFAMLGEPYTIARYEQIKDEPQFALSGMTLREFMIAFSEQFAKPTLGRSVWARSLLHPFITPEVQSLSYGPGIILVPDIGFEAETNTFDDTAGSRFVNVHLRRGEPDWKNDSRGYVTNCQHITVENIIVEDAAAFIVHSLESIYKWQF